MLFFLRRWRYFGEIQKTSRGWCEKLVDVAEDTRCAFAPYLQAVRSVRNYGIAQIAHNTGRLQCSLARLYCKAESCELLLHEL